MHRLQERLKHRRNRLDWSQDTLAQKSGVSRRIISSIESGEATKNDTSITISTITDLASALGVNPLWLLGSDKIDGNEMEFRDQPDHTLEAIQKLEQAEDNIDAAKRLLMPGKKSFSYREKLGPDAVNLVEPSEATRLANVAEEKSDREHRKSK